MGSVALDFIYRECNYQQIAVAVPIRETSALCFAISDCSEQFFDFHYFFKRYIVN